MNAMVELTQSQIDELDNGGEVVIEVQIHDSEGEKSHVKAIPLTKEDE